MLPAPTTSEISTPRPATAGDLARDALDALGVGAVLEPAHQRLTGKLQQQTAKRGLGRRHHSSPTTKRAKRAIRTFSPVFDATSARSCSIVLPS